VNPSVENLRRTFGGSIGRALESNGQSVVFVERDALRDVCQWLHDTAGEDYDYLVDLTAVEYRDDELPLEVVYQLRSLERGAELRLKVALPKDEPLEVDSVDAIWRAADWLEREVYDMFGIRFLGHPDLRRILMWDTYSEGHPLRKDFPLRGRFSRAEQVRRALHANPEAHYSMEELSLVQAYHDLPMDMRERIEQGKRDDVPLPPEAEDEDG
jgi:NADH-quinone oxidoreductase subunit C